MNTSSYGIKDLIFGIVIVAAIYVDITNYNRTTTIIIAMLTVSAIYNTHGYFIDIILNETVSVEGKIIKRNSIYLGRDKESSGEKLTIKTDKNKTVEIILFNKIEDQSKKNISWGHWTEYKVIYHCLKLSKVVSQVEYIPIY